MANHSLSAHFDFFLLPPWPQHLETFFRWVFSAVFPFMVLMGPSMVSTVCVGPAAMWSTLNSSSLASTTSRTILQVGIFRCFPIHVSHAPFNGVDYFCGGFIKTHQHPPSCILAIAHLS
ncbi:hypothetical protein K438DRAFT_1812469 [Mycena galopus ATCC 62051]|nr:hypothetical protein K438DRAFT_1812469 [Mycena galopus ATCC 62051]